MTGSGAPPVFRGMPYTFESFDDRAITVTLRGGQVLVRETPLDDVSREREDVLAAVA